MKSFLLLCCTVTFAFSPKWGIAQNANIKIKEDVKLNVKQAFRLINKQTDYKFIYRHDLIKMAPNLELKKGVIKASALLERYLSPIDFTYEFTNKGTIIVKKAPVVAPINSESQIAQMQISGTITDESGIPLAGATVLESGTTNGVSADFDGNYVITPIGDSPVLEITYIGYATQTVSVNGRATINIVLVEDTNELDEVVVTALGIKKDAKALGYSVTKVDNDRILASGTPVNALQSLYGTAAGVTVAGTATGPSGGFKINIRNAVSFDESSTTRPLIVVDGIPIFDENSNIGYNDRTDRDNGTGINDINPDDIESMDILKGAKASVLYGSEGANGVILITTKSGSRSRGLGISASLTTSIENSAFAAEIQDQYGSGRSASVSATDDQGYYINEKGERALDITGAAFGPKFDPNVNLRWWDGSIRPWQANRRSVNDQLFQTGIQRTANVAVSSGGERGSVRFSYTNMNYTPIIPGGKYDKNSFSFNASYDLNDFVSLKYVGNYYVTGNLNAAYAGSLDAQGSRSGLGAYSRDIDVDLIRSALVTDNGYNYFQDEDRRQNFISGGRASVAGSLWDWTQNESNFDRIHGIQSLTLDFKLNKVFSAQILAGLDNTTERSTFKGKLQDPSLIGPNSGSVFRDVNRIIRKTYGQATLNFNTGFNDFNFSGFVGGVIRDNYLEERGHEKIGGMVIPNFFSFTNLPSGVNPSAIVDNGRDKLYGLLGSMQLDWKDQIFVEVQARNDWSSILPPDNNSYFYPGASATWIASNSLNLPSAIKFLKLRTSWADVGRPGPLYFGNVNLGVSQSGNGFILSPPNDLPPIDINDNFRQNLEPENKREFEVGLEGYFFENQRLGLDFSVYRANTYNQIMRITAPPGLGVNTIRLNAGDVQNTGWELGLKTKPVLTDNIEWNLNMTFAASKTKVIKLDDELTSMELFGIAGGLSAIAQVGGEYGLIVQQQGVQNYINPSDDNDPNNGELIVDANGQRYAYSRASNRVVGKILPDLTGGVFNRFRYKNFSLVANIDYSFGATFINEAETYMMAAGVLTESLPYRDAESGGIAYFLNDEGAKVAGVNPGNGPTYNDGVLLDGVRPDGTANSQVSSAEDYYASSYFSNGFFPEDRIFKSDYIALRNVSLEYRIPEISKKIGLTDIVLSVFANNLAYLYKAAPNTIPESSNGTGWGDGAFGTTALPAQRSFGLSVRAKL
ncbi:SusC/RagA family TonB-linked outer membrane protein [Aurantibacter crassamenti]|uniref:SusC/RagA family TonB-linked outer membrane protein n=1 Tax=Aurantibacter crassamenti TaxID=1837375 RepID=UPI00193A7C12|nr:SusC/RagA family TonB-linked outer membrane protein [Aurantibacter crassamenti]MBM1106545.1 SusC/RagA family TonB-linked outer membrane protein [Aurantibacter crassamenti]